MLHSTVHLSIESKLSKKIGDCVPLPIWAQVIQILDFAHQILMNLVPRIGMVCQIRWEKLEKLLIVCVILVVRGWVAISYQLLVALKRISLQTVS